MSTTSLNPPLPPGDLRQLVGPSEDRYYDNPTGRPVFPGLPPSAYDFVFDWGCGCGRIARQLLQQDPQPGRYVGVDLHRGMIESALGLTRAARTDLASALRINPWFSPLQAPVARAELSRLEVRA